MKVHLLVSHFPTDMHNFTINFGVMMQKGPAASDPRNRSTV